MEQDEATGRILVVDDEKSVCELLENWLRSEGYAVRSATSYDQVVALFQEAEFDIVTLDIMMPGVDGMETLRWIRAQFPDVGVIMASALGGLDSVLEAMRLGAINYLIKPFRLPLVTAEIKRGMERQQLIAENRAYRQRLEEKVAARTHEMEAAYAQLSQAHDRLRLQVRELKGRDRLVRFQMSVHGLREACEETLAVFADVLELEWAVLLRCDGSAGPFELLGRRGQRVPGVVSGVEIGHQVGADSKALAAPERTRRDGEIVREGGQVAVPVQHSDELLAVLWCAPPRADTSDDLDVEVLQRLADEAALVLRGAMVTDDLEAWGRPMDELEGLDL